MGVDIPDMVPVVLDVLVAAGAALDHDSEKGASGGSGGASGGLSRAKIEVLAEPRLLDDNSDEAMPVA